MDAGADLYLLWLLSTLIGMPFVGVFLIILTRLLLRPFRWFTLWAVLTCAMTMVWRAI